MGDLIIRLKKEGHNVLVFIDDKKQRCNLFGMIKQTRNWRSELKWVGKDGLIIFDSIGHGNLQDKLRASGYSVVGGSALGDKLEDSRQIGQKFLSLAGVKLAPSVNFTDVKQAIEFIRKNKGPWVIKQNGHVDKAFNYVGQFEDNHDVEEVLRSYLKNNKADCGSIDLQKRVYGIEIGVGRYFNGTDWVGPIEMNLEHKGLCNNDLGPKTYEMGTLMWYDADENNKLFQEVLAKLKPILAKGNFRGDVDVNCIVNEDGAFPLEITARFGFPALQLQSEIHLSPWGEFLKAVADGKQYDLKYKEGYATAVLVAVPPFPYAVSSKRYSPVGLEVSFKDGMTNEDLEHVHFEDVSREKKGVKEKYYISSASGFVLHVTGLGESVEVARSKTYDLIKKVFIPKMFYRTDIGVKFMTEDHATLKAWGWLK